MVMPIPTWIMRWVRDFLFNKETAALADFIRKDDPAIVPALRAYDAGATFMEIVKVYVTATGDKGTQTVDAGIEEFRAMLEGRPFNEVLPLLAVSVAKIEIPDGDGDNTNNITVGVALGRIKEKIIE